MLKVSKVALGTDEITPLTDFIESYLTENGYKVVKSAMADPWPIVGQKVGQAVVEGTADMGIVCCWTGTGVCIAANKVTGVRAALCSDMQIAEGARKYNDANVLALGLSNTTPELAEQILSKFLITEPDSTEQENISKLS